MWGNDSGHGALMAFYVLPPIQDAPSLKPITSMGQSVAEILYVL
jgi:hypothetical protein